VVMLVTIRKIVTVNYNPHFLRPSHMGIFTIFAPSFLRKMLPIARSNKVKVGSVTFKERQETNYLVVINSKRYSSWVRDAQVWSKTPVKRVNTPL
jgi:hypothetical protein